MPREHLTPSNRQRAEGSPSVPQTAGVENGEWLGNRDETFGAVRKQMVFHGNVGVTRYDYIPNLECREIVMPVRSIDCHTLNK